MQTEIREYLSGILGKSDFTLLSVSGGDIARSFLLDDGDQRYFLKIQDGTPAYDMLKAEQRGLDEIRKTGTIRVPEVFHCDRASQSAILLMEYIRPRQPVARDYERLGLELARLHQVSADTFGFDHDNFIGSLPQRNICINDWTTFYVRNRLMPQIQLALSTGMLSHDDVPDEGVMTERLDPFLAEVRPSLVHGDLWSGNYLISHEGVPVLIDPAVYYGHSEVDLAMSRLFGGFGQSFYSAYTDVHPEQSAAAERNDLYQLYYLLVHLNLFGHSYRRSVLNILHRYFSSDT